MKKSGRRLLIALAALVAVIPLTVAPAYANSGPRYESGETGGGVLVRNEKSALAVESESLTFNVCDFPQEYGQTAEYKSTVTAEYKFVNTSENAVHTSMAFPLGNIPDYATYLPPPGMGELAKEEPTPVITVDGKRVEAQVRHTLGGYLGGSEGFERSVSTLLDDWYEDDFYKPDMPVTAYTVKVDRGDYSDIALLGKVTCDRSKARYLCPNGYGNEMDYYYYETDSTFEELVERGQYVFYVLGDESAFNVEWEVFEERYRFGHLKRYPVDLPVEVKELTDKDGQPVYPTLKDLILSDRQSKVVSEMDYYNGVAQSLYDYEDNAYGGDFRSFPTSDYYFCTWYTYEVDVEPRGSITNTVTAPLYPDIYHVYSPYVYEYNYYLSPAKGWASFGKLEIKINTEYYGNFLPANFTEVDGGYAATYDGLPEGELTFRLCSEENPEYVGGHVGTAIPWWVILIFIGLISVPLVGVIAALVVIPCVLLAKTKAK